MFEQLIKLIRQEKVSAFIGAGFSIEASAPSVGKLKEIILKEFDDKELQEAHQDDGLDQLTEFYVNEICSGSRNQLISLMKNAFEFSPACMDDHKMLANIPHIKTIFTTNYDTLLEDSYPEAERDIVRNDVDCAYSSKPFKIVKVHGDFTAPDSVVVTKSDYEKFHKKMPNPTMWKMVESEFVSKHILFIGYSLEDDNILKIIKTISKNVGRNQKQMFLIAPGFNAEKQEKLKKLGVKYFDAYATEFLNELTESLKENICDDFRQKKVSAETYTKFCHIHKCLPELAIHQDGKNDIIDIKAEKGTQLKHNLIFTVSSKVAEKIKNHDFVTDGELVNGCDFIKDVPSIRLSGDKLQKCVHKINGLVYNKDIPELIISPAPKQMELTISIPSIGFGEIVEANYYNLDGKTLLIIIDCQAFILNIRPTFIDGKHKQTSINFEFKESYKNNNEAIKWIDLLIAFFSNEDVYIKEILSKPFKAQEKIDITPCPFIKYKQYYTNIKDIELLMGKRFTVYEGYNEERYNYSCIILAYLKKNFLAMHTTNQDIDFDVPEQNADKIHERYPLNQKSHLIVCVNAVPHITLNQMEFCIPYKNIIFNSCTIKDVRLDKDTGSYKVTFLILNSECQVLYSDKRISEADIPEDIKNKLKTDNE